MNKSILIAAACCFSSQTVANGYHLFTQAEWVHQQSNNWLLSAEYFPELQENNHVLADFGFIDAFSSIKLAIVEDNDHSAQLLDGEYFFEQVSVIGGIQNNENGEDYWFGMGYMVRPDMKLDVTRFQNEQGNNTTVWGLSQEYTIKDLNYIAWSIRSDNGADNWELYAKYFDKTNSGYFYSIELTQAKTDGEDSATSASGYFYFNRYTSLGAHWQDSHPGISVQHFFNRNISLAASYTDEDNSWAFSLNGQF